MSSSTSSSSSGECAVVQAVPPCTPFSYANKNKRTHTHTHSGRQAAWWIFVSHRFLIRSIRRSSKGTTGTTVVLMNHQTELQSTTT